MALPAKEDDRLSLISPIGYSASSCGYCTPSGSGQRSKTKSSKSYGIWANNITAETYQQLIDRGWRRSGHYIYRPDCGYQGTCCPQIAIRVRVDGYRPRSDQRRAVSALQRLVRQPVGVEARSSSKGSLTVVPSHKGKYTHQWDIEKQWKSIEWSEPEEYHWQLFRATQSNDESKAHLKLEEVLKPIHQSRAQFALEERRIGKEKGHTKLPPLLGPKRRRFESTLRAADSTSEKYALFCSYQMKIHGESESKVSSRQGFERLLCESPLMPYVAGSESEVEAEASSSVDVASEKPIPYNLYHMEYRFEGRLVAVGVLDVLPRSISSVYLFYDPDFAHLHLGKVSAIREMALVKQIQRKKGMGDVQYYNLGLYVHSCAKMRYKAEYRPAEILDPQTCTWIPYDAVKAQMDRRVRYSFLQDPPTAQVLNDAVNGASDEGRTELKVSDSPESESEEEDDDDDERHLPQPPPPGIMDPKEIPYETLARCMVFDHGRVDLLLRTKLASDRLKLAKIVECLAALGPLYKRVVLYS